LDADLQNELAQYEGNEKKQEEIRKKYAKKRKALAIKEAIIKGAQAVLNGLLTQPFIPAGIAAGIAAGIQTGFQIATIKKQKFGLGGKVPIARHGMAFGTFKGASHESGGIDLFTGSGKHVANVEGNENFYVLKKSASDYLNTLSEINQRFGGVPLTTKGMTFQDGGQITTEQGNTEVSDLTENVIKNLPPIVVRVEDIKTGISDVDQVINAGVI
jgi:hypothetical protein